MAFASHRAGIFAHKKIKIGPLMGLKNMVYIKLCIASVIPWFIRFPVGPTALKLIIINKQLKSTLAC